jgi:hypothetical protein
MNPGVSPPLSITASTTVADKPSPLSTPTFVYNPVVVQKSEEVLRTHPLAGVLFPDPQKNSEKIPEKIPGKVSERISGKILPNTEEQEDDRTSSDEVLYCFSRIFREISSIIRPIFRGNFRSKRYAIFMNFLGIFCGA